MILLSPAQLQAYFDRIDLPQRYRPSSSPIIDEDYLHALHVHQIGSIFYENLDLHYDARHTIAIDIETLYGKIVASGRNRGGYCMAIGLLFHCFLRTLGLRTYMAPARSRPRDINNVPSGDPAGISHLVHIVTLDNDDKYALDVSFGGDGPTKPMKLEHGKVVTNLGAQEVRLMYEHLDIHADPAAQPKHWHYQYRNGVGKEWNTFYSFAEYEFFPQDFLAINYGVAHDMKNSFQTYTVIVVKFVLGEGESGRKEVVEKVTLKDAVVKRNSGGRTEVVKVCRSEAERVDVLRELFGIILTEEETASIRGWNTEIKPDA
jgi:arylamine N-acetyltransferase